MSESPVVRLVEVTEEHAGQRLDNFLLRMCKGVPKSHIYKAIRGGQVRINKGRCSADSRLEPGDTVRIPPFRLPAETAQAPVPGCEFPIVYEDDALLVVDKPAGVAVHGGSGVSFGVIEQLRAARPQARFLELAHRLDRDTSGLLLVAKKRSALLGLHEMFREGRGRKHYFALVHGDWVNGRQHIRLPLLKWLTRTGERRVRVDEQEGQAAHTIISLERRYGEVSLVDAELRTGRTHQIRVHLSASGFPIVGDDKYGDEAADAALVAKGFRRMFLHAHRLEIPHPVSGEALRLVAQLPPECENLLLVLDKASGTGGAPAQGQPRRAGKY
ncbi:RluA family pseudouridine synthase [Kerstersia gyiorum]|uniref:Pseudouridine synthase n=1 Tax=Kerstersia gyiorum TaxID=206506 RepID=A0A171KVV0_9BURK|nr:RluA family pseudouridine synthase [Kerstersia gyiorum]MCO7635522.1 RluA family pseudouridine synthase [Pseudomonas sp. S 311-6]KAB0541919.1 RluA family pseudouridine synthase [Kerstersia gyiorum]KKO73017.1 pseudouridine synthase [Kerstersia gyiorum]MCP1632479.1 23S rRNA pseudouridine955/2504/2580 synthase [Kerstersia gyiorum]MCP1635015.1 23S rRNA pseudouridine955/2504/2580 synthase [Kerstersia gyiorum]